MPFIPGPHLLFEDRVLLTLLRREELDRSLLPDAGAWQRLIRRARVHRVEPHLLDLLHRLPAGAMPEEVAASVVLMRRAWNLRSLRQDQRSQKILSTLARTGLPVLVLKGPALAGAAYANPEVRADIADLDLLVPAERHPDALEAVHELGYRLRDPDLAVRYHRPFHMHDVLVGGDGHILEIHWALSRPDDLFRLDPEEFIRHATTDDDTPGILWTSPTDLLLHTASQGLGEGFGRLQRIIDAEGLLRRQAATIDWARLNASASRGGLSPSLWLLLELARGLLAAPPAPSPPPRPAALSRAAMATLDPATSLASTFAYRHSSLRLLYTLWLVTGPWQRLRAAVRMIRGQAMHAARRPRGMTRAARLAAVAGRFITFGKLVAYQVVRVAAWPWRPRDHGAIRHLTP